MPEGRLRAFARRRAVKVTGIVLAALLGSFVVGATTFHVACKGEPESAPAYAPAEVAAFAAEFPEYRRTEESTYLTLLEWYQVFSYQEYAAWVATEKPSGFPYFAAIGQSWRMYCAGYGRTADYPFNFGNHLMLSVIGTSFTVEYALKGAWENTVGRITEFDSYTTPEDRFAADLAYDYGQFVPHEPWYAYPFGSEVVDLWTETPLFGWDVARKAERKLFLTTENGAKAGYAGVIKVATGAVYGAPPATDYLWVENFSDALFDVEGVGKAKDLGNGSYVITLPHYQGFTDAVPQLARGGARFLDISGNDVIVMTVLAPEGWDPAGAGAEGILTLDVLTQPGLDRFVVRAPVRELHTVLLALDRDGVVTEHLFDY